MNHPFRVSLMLLVWLWSVRLTGAPAAQQVDAVCTILKKPSAFSGKIVQIKGTVKVGFEDFSLSEGGCGRIWIDYADDKDISPHPKFKLVRDVNFSEFERLIRASSMAEVTLIGRLDGVDAIFAKTYVSNQRKHRDGTSSADVRLGSNGFGHMGQFKARLVLKQVLTVASTQNSQPRPPQ